MLPYAFAAIVSLLYSCANTDCGHVVHDAGKNEDRLFTSFSRFKEYESKYRIGLRSDSVLYHFRIKALTTANFDSVSYLPNTIYILTHESGDSIVIESSDMPLLNHEQFASFYHANENHLSADTLIDSAFLNQFCVVPKDKIDIERISHLPFLFIDVNFDGYPALLVRHSLGNDLYKYQVYGISKSGFNEVNLPPYNALKSRINQWCYGGATEFDYTKKTITVHQLASGSCSDYGTQITQIYTLNPTTEKFELQQLEHRYDCNY